MTARRWPLEPLAALMGGMGAMTRMGFDSGELSRARRVGLSDLLADRWSVRCGLHPSLVWADWTDAAEADRRQRDAERKRRAYRKNPKARAARIAASAAYRAAHPEYVARSHRMYREANREAINRRERERYHARPLSELNQKK